MTEDDRVLVSAEDVRILMDYYQRGVSHHWKTKKSDEAYERLWTVLETVGGGYYRR